MTGQLCKGFLIATDFTDKVLAALQIHRPGIGCQRQFQRRCRGKRHIG